MGSLFDLTPNFLTLIKALFVFEDVRRRRTRGEKERRREENKKHNNTRIRKTQKKRTQTTATTKAPHFTRSSPSANSRKRRK